MQQDGLGLTDDNRPIVLITFNPHETREVVRRFCGKSEPSAVFKDGVPYYVLGALGGSTILLTVSRQAVTRAHEAAEDACDHWQPQALIGVGIAFGVNPTQQNYGDVLVSESAYDYELARVNDVDHANEARGLSEPASDDLIRRFRAVDHFGRLRTRAWPKIWFGCVLSGNKLVDNAKQRDEWVSQAGGVSRVVGGEMEALGLARAVGRAGRKGDAVSWIIVKGICDFADGSVNNANKEANQALAARKAALVVYRALGGKKRASAGDSSSKEEFTFSKKEPPMPNLGRILHPLQDMDEVKFDSNSYEWSSESRYGINEERIQEAQDARAKLAFALDQYRGKQQHLIVIDLDRFTSLNAVYGESASNLAAESVHWNVEQWCRSISERDEKLRILGWRSNSDEWFIFISSLKAASEEEWLKRTAEGLLEHIRSGDYSGIASGFFITGCAGFATRHDDKESALHLLRRAFGGLRKAKSLGGNSCCRGPSQVRLLNGESAELEDVAMSMSDGLVVRVPEAKNRIHCIEFDFIIPPRPRSIFEHNYVSAPRSQSPRR
jgi:nucleoside phosphorylase/GGDEF domain-containing protein